MDGEVAGAAVQISVTPSYRRNGKLFSCEPCRRGKLRCDHGSPVCGRCLRRNKPEQCVYHPAPLTKQRTSPIIGPRRTIVSAASSPRRSYIEPYPTPTAAAQPNGRASSLSGLETQQISGRSGFDSLNESSARSTAFRPQIASSLVSMEEPNTPPSHASIDNAATSFRNHRIGFLGPTAYSAVYTENSNVLNPPKVDIIPPDLVAITAEKIQQGADVLSLLRDLPVYRKFSQRFFELWDGLILSHSMLQVYIEETWDTFRQLLEEGRPDQLRDLSELVWRNTRKPMQVHGSMTAQEWARAASGPNLRWETVGVMLSLVGLVAMNLSDWDSIFDEIRPRYVDRGTFSERMRKASEFCLCFCYESEVLNDIYLCFMHEDLILVESMKGEVHYAAWQRTGEFCDAIVAMGLHQGNYTNERTPFFLAEMRKKLFIAAYGRDKVVASFLGRPPRLSHRYCKMEAPLDLTDKQLISEGEELQLALAGLDANGWNTSGNLNRITFLRVWFNHCRLREDILEIALGSGQEDLVSRVDQVRAKMDRMYDSVPDFMRVTVEEVLNGAEPSTGLGPATRPYKKPPRQSNVIFVLLIQTGMAHTEFLLQRALVSRLRTSTKQLIPASRRMLQLVLLAQSKKEYFRDFTSDLMYLLAFHGLPAAGVLAVELLKQEQTKQYTPSLLPRSETVQDLSVFISALAAVGPGEGNSSICEQGRRALKKVLDQILSPTTAPPPPVDGLTGMDEATWGFPIGNDADFLSWLDNVEWDKRDWGEPTIGNGQIGGP